MLSNTAVPIEYGRFREQVLSGEIPVCKEISMQMNRIDYLIESPEFYYDENSILGFTEFCETELVLTNGDPVHLLPTFKLWAESALSWYYYTDEKYYDYHIKGFNVRKVLKRLIHKQYLIIPRSNAKSMYLSFMQAYFLVMDKRSKHQVAVAPTMKQANETLEPLSLALTLHPGPILNFLTKGSKLSTNPRTKVKLAKTKDGIRNYVTGSHLEVYTMSIDKLQGLRVPLATVDEWLSGDTKEDVIGALEQGAAKGNVDYLIIAASSEGTVRNGIGDTIKMELLKILRGDVYDPHTDIWYYKLDSLEEIAHPELWMKACPNIGATVSYETYIQDVQRAETQLHTRSDILAKRFGIPLEGFTYFFTYEETLCHAIQNYDGLECSLGADMSQGDDFCAFTFVFPLGNERFGIKTRAYVSENKVRKLPLATQEKYDQFAYEGSLVIMPGGILDMMRIYDDLNEYIYQHNYIVVSFGYDPYNATSFINRWSNEHTSFGITKVIQGAKTESVPLGQIKRLSEDRNLIFDQELFKFAMGHAIAIQDNNGNYKLSKKRSDEKIDNVAALLDAWVAYQRNQEVYN